MAIRVNISFREGSAEDLKILNYLETKRSKSIFIKELIEKEMQKEEEEKRLKELKEKMMLEK